MLVDRRFGWAIFFNLLFGSVTTYAISCDFFLTQKSRTQRTEAFAQSQDQLSRIVEDQLAQAGFKVSKTIQPNELIQRRTKQLAARMNPYQFENEKYRQFWIEKLIDLKISENLTVIDDLNLRLKKNERRALTRLILRSVIAQGLLDLPSADKNPNAFAKFMKATRRIRHNPAFRFLVEWRLPKKDLVLTESQLLAIADRGLDGLDASVLAAIQSDHKTETIQRANSLVVAVVSVYSAYFYFNILYPKAEIFYENNFVRPAAEAKKEYIAQAESKISAVQSDPIKLSYAAEEIEIVEVDFINRHGSTPTASEAQEIRRSICLDPKKFGKISSAQLQQQCLAL